MVPSSITANARLTSLMLPQSQLSRNDDLLRALVEARPASTERVSHADLHAIRRLPSMLALLTESASAIFGTAPQTGRTPDV